MITFDEFKKVEIRAGKILAAEKVPNTDKLLKLSVDFGEFEVPKEEKKDLVTGEGVGVSAVIEEEKTGAKTAQITPTETVAAPKIPKPRQIISGISGYFPDASTLIGKTCMFVTNLEPRMIKGLESNGMLFAVSTPTGGFSLLEPNSTIPPGTIAI